MNRPSPIKIRRAVADVLLTLSAGYVGLTVFAPLWFPYDLAIAVSVCAFAWLIGDYEHRWWPVTPMRDREHEFNVERDARK